MDVNKIIQGDCLAVLKTLPDQSVNCCITSPPYWGLRDYGVTGQLGLEKTPEEYVAHMVEVFREVRRVLRDDGTCWLNLVDSYAGSGKGSNPDGTPHPSTLLGKRGTNTGTVTGHNMPQKAHEIGLKPKDLVGIPWRVAFALQADGWYLRQDIIWHKPNPMPESVTDRCTKAHEYIFLLAKSGTPTIWQARDTEEWSYNPDFSERLPHPTEKNETISRWRGHDYYYDAEAIQEKNSKDNRSVTICVDRKRSGSPLMWGGDHERWPNGENRNRRSVWTVTTKPFKEAHFATFPPDLIEPCAIAGCPENGVILDPFMGAGTTAVVAKQNYRNYIGIELNQKYIEIAQKRIDGTIVNKRLGFKENNK